MAAQPNVDTVTLGARTASQLEDNIQAAYDALALEAEWNLPEDPYYWNGYPYEFISRNSYDAEDYAYAPAILGDRHESLTHRGTAVRLPR